MVKAQLLFAAATVAAVSAFSPNAPQTVSLATLGVTLSGLERPFDVETGPGMRRDELDGCMDAM